MSKLHVYHVAETALEDAANHRRKELPVERKHMWGWGAHPPQHNSLSMSSAHTHTLCVFQMLYVHKNSRTRLRQASATLSARLQGRAAAQRHPAASCCLPPRRCVMLPCTLPLHHVAFHPRRCVLIRALPRSSLLCTPLSHQLEVVLHALLLLRGLLLGQLLVGVVLQASPAVGCRPMRANARQGSQACACACVCVRV